MLPFIAQFQRVTNPAFAAGIASSLLTQYAFGSSVGGFLAIVAGVLFWDVRVDSGMIGTVIGYISAKADTIVNYFFGSSKGSDEKNAIIGQIASGTGNGA